MKKKIFLFATLLWGATAYGNGQGITISRLLDELVSYESVTLYPNYTCRQISSYDRRSVAPDKAFWFADDDGSGYMYIDRSHARAEKVLFEAEGPGVITRIWQTTLTTDGVMRFYFDNETTPRLVVDAYDMNHVPFYVGESLLLKHTHYEKGVRGGTTCFLPIPYAKRCKVTFEDQYPERNLPHYYQFNYRTYPVGTKVRTFTVAEVMGLKKKLQRVNALLATPKASLQGRKQVMQGQLSPEKSQTLSLLSGSNAVTAVRIHVHCDKARYQTIMENTLIIFSFDGRHTVSLPLSLYAAGGYGAHAVQSWYVTSDGCGEIESRWPMPYRKEASVTLENHSTETVDVSCEFYSKNYTWRDNSLYFHAASKFQREIPIGNDYNSNDNIEWNFNTLSGRGVYRGDVLTLYNRAPDWYGEGDEKIWVDDDLFPSHFGTGTEDYYNCSWAPVVPFNTPFGGAPRAEEASSHGYNTFFRTRNLDAIPFEHRLKFDIEMLGWHKSTVDYLTAVFWYGDLDSDSSHEK